MGFAIYEVGVGAGALAIAPRPAASNINAIATWSPDLVVSLIEPHEGDVSFLNVFAWRDIPIADYGTPQDEALDLVIGEAVALIRNGGRVLFHCKGGCGRSGMAAARILYMFDVAEPIAALRAVRPCAVETDAQAAWVLRAATK